MEKEVDEKKIRKRREKQLGLSAGYDEDKKTIITLQELIDRKVDLLDHLTQLSIGQKAHLTIERIKTQEKYEIYIVGEGTIDKDRAIKEIEDSSELGRRLIEIEERAMQMALEDIQKER